MDGFAIYICIYVYVYIYILCVRLSDVPQSYCPSLSFHLVCRTDFSRLPSLPIRFFLTLTSGLLSVYLVIRLSFCLFISSRVCARACVWLRVLVSVLKVHIFICFSAYICLRGHWPMHFYSLYMCLITQSVRQSVCRSVFLSVWLFVYLSQVD